MANFVLGGFFQFGQICVWEILNIYFKDIFNLYRRAFFNKKVGRKTFGKITLKLGAFIKRLVIK